MGKFDKFKKIFKTSSEIASPFIPGGIGSILKIVNAGLGDTSDPANEGPIRAIAEVNDAQTNALIAIDERLRKLEERFK